MREIKFRAWLKEEKKMLDVIIIGFTSTGKCEGARCFHSKIHGGPWYYYLEEGLILMQHTGLKDVAERDIFEGDIIEIHKYGIGVVEWNNIESRFECKGVDIIGDFNEGDVYIGCILEDSDCLLHKLSQYQTLR